MAATKNQLLALYNFKTSVRPSDTYVGGHVEITFGIFERAWRRGIDRLPTSSKHFLD
jgi:hypothetical protein